MSAPVSQGQQSILARCVRAGAELEEAQVVLVMLHGRGASAESIISLFDDLKIDGVAAVAPQAPGRTWYPQSFLKPRAENAPNLEESLDSIRALLNEIDTLGIPRRRVVLIGFSQGACLSLETAARTPARYGGIVAFTGGLIGEESELVGYSGTLSGTPVFIGSGDPDAHVPFARVERSAAIFRDLGADVDVRRYVGMPHTINEDELAAAQSIIAAAADSSRRIL